MNKFLRLAGAVVLGLPLISFAQTNSVAFDADGSGAAFGAQTITIFDWAVGNAVSVGGAGVQTGDVNRLLYQANLGTTKNGSAIVTTNGTGGASFLTLVASFEEQATVIASPGFVNVNFALVNPVASATNYFRIYANNSNYADDLAGTGFTNGDVILSGFVSAITSSNFSTDGTADTFDQSANGDDYGGAQSIVGSGATRLAVTITGVDNAYFPGFSLTGLEFSFFNTSQVTPFSEVDPSRQFDADGLPGGTQFVPVLGPVNGFDRAGGVDFQFQADANQSFRTPAVPEPGSLALAGAALAALGFAARRRKA